MYTGPNDTALWDGEDYFLDNVPPPNPERYQVGMFFFTPDTGLWNILVKQITGGDFNHFHLDDWLRYSFPSLTNFVHSGHIMFSLDEKDAALFKMFMADRFKEHVL